MKQKYPNYYLWTCNIFLSHLYKDFECQVLAAVADNEQAFSTSQMLQAVLPDLASSIRTGFEQLAAKFQVLQSNQEAMEQRMEAGDRRAEENDKRNAQNFADFFALGYNLFNGNDSSPSLPLPSSSSPSLVSPLSSVAPNYSMSRSIVTIVDVWREYDVGLGNGPSVKRLEEQFGTGWRKDKKESRFFSRRKEIYTMIEEKAEEEMTSCTEAARRLEETRARLKLSIDKFRITFKPQ